MRPKEPTWLHLGSPRTSKIEAETRKNRCWKTTHFRHRFLEGSDLILERFLVGLLDLSRPLAHVCRKWSDVNKTSVLVVRKRHRHFCDIGDFKPKSTKKRLCLRTSILEAFWDGFGRPKSSIFALLSMFFSKSFLRRVRRGKNGETEPFWRPKGRPSHHAGYVGTRSVE